MEILSLAISKIAENSEGEVTGYICIIVSISSLIKTMEI